MKLWVGFCLLFFPASAYAVLWEEQAERLQKISATLVDYAPVHSPVLRTVGIRVYGDINILPKLNTTVGSKSEDVPAPPVSTVPSLEGRFSFKPHKLFSLGFGGHVGFLPSGAESLLGLTASAESVVYGAWMQVGWSAEDFNFEARVGTNVATTTVTGGVTLPESNDAFDSQNTSPYLSYLMMYDESLYGGFTLLSRRATSSFFIEADNTEFFFKDKQDCWIQLFVGYFVTDRFSVGLALAHIPERATIPKLSFSYTVSWVER